MTLLRKGKGYIELALFRKGEISKLSSTSSKLGATARPLASIIKRVIYDYGAEKPGYGNSCLGGCGQVTTVRRWFRGPTILKDEK